MFCSTFNLVTTCRTAVLFGTLKDGSLQINSLALNNCFSYRNIFQNGVNTLSKRFKKPGFFLVKKLKFCVVWIIQISPACGKDTFEGMYGETLDFQCQH